eukprot:gnl/MRDRNA2_/MRDRNA2_70425_c0_seq2.p1 gnl/MRDRNA2_/MRDRNA2_70425_c0~~gnl/MRDRNA2_/MRDRNA2_70425_c0_seq2.p1  ORF type:complete len:101 (-),score=9.30 gnl/MRDRNA2_/MRDRNA2_70425_c0_seq2:95-397(-)
MHNACRRMSNQLSAGKGVEDQWGTKPTVTAFLGTLKQVGMRMRCRHFVVNYLTPKQSPFITVYICTKALSWLTCSKIDYSQVPSALRLKHLNDCELQIAN